MTKLEIDYMNQLRNLNTYLMYIHDELQVANKIADKRNQIMSQDIDFRQFQQTSVQDFNIQNAKNWERYKWKREQQKILYAKLPWYKRMFTVDILIEIPKELEHTLTIENYDKPNYVPSYKGGFQ